MTRYSISRLLLAAVLSLVFCLPLVAQTDPVENVVLISLDGLRWQELFGGADERLINKEDGDVDDPDLTRSKFLADDKMKQRELLMPFFWKTVAKKGQVFGAPEKGSKVVVENGRYFSYPGYNELLTGFADKKIDSNAKKYNQNVTVLEWLHRSPDFKGRVAAFCSWDVFPFIINTKRSGIPVNAGWQPLETFERDADLAHFNQMANQLPRYWQSVRYDVFTFRGAAEYMKVKKPRLIYIALGETDDWAHAGRYDLYLEAARANDDFIRQIWELTEQLEQYKNKTAFVITTDHGRGDGREGWKNHSDELPGSDQIWIAVMGPNVPALGIREKVNGTQGQVAATVAKLLGKDFTEFDDRIAPPLRLE